MLQGKAGRCEGYGEILECSMGGTWGSLKKMKQKRQKRDREGSFMSYKGVCILSYEAPLCNHLFSLLVSLVMPSSTFIWAFAMYLFN